MNTVFIHTSLTNAKETLAPGLFDGQLGICLYLFHTGQEEEAKSWLHAATEALPRLHGNLRVADGLGGAGWVMQSLFAKGLLKGDLEKVVSEIDAAMFRHYAYPACDEKQSLAETVHLLYYLTDRWQAQKAGSDTEFLYRRLIGRMLGNLFTQLGETSQREEPPYYTLDYALPQAIYYLSKLLRYEPFKQRIVKMTNVYASIFYSVFPQNQGNRLYWLGAWDALLMHREMQGEEAIRYRNILYHSIDPEYIFSHEMGRNSIYVRDGVAGLYFLLKRIRAYRPRREEFRKRILKWIEDSPEWELLATNQAYARSHLGLYSGICGTAWAYKQMIKEGRRSL